MRFSIGRPRQLICMLSLWAITGAALPTTQKVLASQPVLSPHEGGDHASAHVIREGTLIAPTQGRVAMLGRRWVFIPDPSSLLYKQLIGESPNDVLGDKLGKRSRMIRIVKNVKQAQRPNQDKVFIDRNSGVNRLIGPVTLVSSPRSLVSSRSNNASSQEQAADSSPAGQLVLVENLMLQRIVDSVRSDLSDDRWVVSGTINEFFGENRMVLSSAQRGSAE